MPWIKLKEAVKTYNRSRQYLDKLSLKLGKIKRRKIDNKVEYETDSMDNYFGCQPYSETMKSTLFKKKGINPHRKTGKKNIDIDKDDDNFEFSTTISEVEIDLKKTKIKAQNIKNEVSEGKLVNREKEEVLFFEIARKVRDSLESIPARLSGLLVEKTKHEIEQLLIEEIKNTLTNLSMEL